MAAIAAVLFIFAPEVSSILTSDPNVWDQTVSYLRYNLLVAPFMALGLSFSGGLQGAGDTRGVLMVIFFAMWLIRLPLAYLLGVAWDWGARGVWLAMIISMAIQGILMLLRFHMGKWKSLEV